MGRAREIADLIGGTTPDIILKTSDGAILNLQTSDTTVTADSVLGAINFQAPDEASGTDAILLGAGIDAVAEGTFSASSNATKLSFKTASSAAASETMSLSSAGLLTIADDLVIGDDKTIGSATTPAAITIASNGLVTISRSDNAENLSLVSTDADASVGPTLRLDRQSASAADGDLLGKINFVGHNDAGTPEDIAYAGITAIISDASDGTEDGKLAINTILAGTERSRLFIDGGETVFNEDSVDVDFRVESNGNANALFVDAGTGDGVVICGSNTVVGRFGAPLEVTTHGGTNRGGLMISNFQNAATDSIIDFNKSRNNTVGSHTIVQDDDNIGSLIFRGSDGSAFVDAAAIGCQVDGTPGSNDMPGRLVFFTTPDGASGGSERMRIASDGQISIGNNNPSDDTPAIGFTFNQSGTTTSFLNIGHTSSAGTSDGFVRFVRSNSIIGQIRTDGVSNVQYATSSDYRLKENIVTEWDATSRLKQLKPSRFNFKEEKDRTRDGFIAHEVSSIVPEAVGGEKDAMTKEVLYVEGEEIPEGKKVGDVKKPSKIDPQTIDHSKLVPLLTKALQEAISEIETLKTKVTALEGG